MTALGAAGIAMVWSVGGVIGMVTTIIGVLVKWNSHDQFDVELAKIAANAKLKELELEMEREKRLLS